MRKRGGGIVVYVKMKSTPYITEFPEINTMSGDVEVLWLMSDPPKQRKMLIGTVDQIPSGKVQSAIDILDNNLAVLESTEPMAECVIMGDSNIDYKKSGSAESKYLKEFERNHQLKQYIKQPTRITNNVRSTIDLIF